MFTSIPYWTSNIWSIFFSITSWCRHVEGHELHQKDNEIIIKFNYILNTFTFLLCMYLKKLFLTYAKKNNNKLLGKKLSF